MVWSNKSNFGYSFHFGGCRIYPVLEIQKILGQVDIVTKLRLKKMGNFIKLSLEKTLENSVKGQYYEKSNETFNYTDFIPDPMMVWFIFIFLDFCVCVLAQSQFLKFFHVKICSTQQYPC